MSQTTTSTDRIVAKGAGVLLIAGALFGASAGLAQASTPGAAPVGSAYPTASHTPTAGDAVILNVSPFPARVADLNSTRTGGTIAPGQSLVLTAAQLRAFQGSDVEVTLDLGDGYTAEYAFDDSQSQPGTHSCASVPNSDSRVGCVSQVPAGGPTQYTVWSAGTPAGGVNTIDTTAPGVDSGAIGTFLSGMQGFRAGWISYAPDPDTAPTWGKGAQTLAGSPVFNCGQGDASETIGGATEHSETTSLEAGVTATMSSDLFDLVNASLSTTITSGDAWTDTTSTNFSESKTIPANFVGWMTVEPSTETVTGTMTITGNATQPIAFTHVSFTEPGRNPSNNPNLDYTYTAHSMPMTKDQVAQQCTAGPTALAHTASGDSLPDITAGAMK